MGAGADGIGVDVGGTTGVGIGTGATGAGGATGAPGDGGCGVGVAAIVAPLTGASASTS